VLRDAGAASTGDHSCRNRKGLWIMASRLLRTADGQHDHHQRLTRGPCVVVFGVTTNLQRRAAANCKRHSQKMPSRRFLGRDPPACSCKPSAEVRTFSSCQEHIKYETVLLFTYTSACLARLSTTVGNLPLSSHTRTRIAEDLLSQDRRVRTRREPATDHVRSVEVLFFFRSRP
jgi:hypothetical protein